MEDLSVFWVSGAGFILDEIGLVRGKRSEDRREEPLLAPSPGVGFLAAVAAPK